MTAAPLNFASVRECTDWRDRHALEQWSDLGPRKGMSQIQCHACKRWCYPDERCNQFTTYRVDGF